MATLHSLFVHRYMDRDVAVRDSEPFRIRAEALFVANTDDEARSSVVESLASQAGIRVPRGEIDNSPKWRQFFDRAPVAHVLTALTLTIRAVRGRPGWGLGLAVRLKDEMRRILAEENMGYLVDDDGTVRVAIDEDFAAQRVSTLQGLGDPRLFAAREHYEAAHAAMNEPKDTRVAVREVFDALEVVAKLLAPNHRNLNANMVRNELEDATVQAMPGDAVLTGRVWPGMFQGFAGWVTAAHNIRHGQPTGREVDEDFAIYAVSSGGAFLRLLCRVHAVLNP